MLNWLNYYLGIDWATYIGLGLAVVGLLLSIFASNKRKNITQKTHVKGGTSIQVGGDLKLGSSDDTKSHSK